MGPSVDFRKSIIVETFYCKCLLQRMGIFRFALFSQRNERAIDGII